MTGNPELLACPTPSEVQDEMERIHRLFLTGGGDSEDLLTYAKEVVTLRMARTALSAPSASLPDEEAVELRREVITLRNMLEGHPGRDEAFRVLEKLWNHVLLASTPPPEGLRGAVSSAIRLQLRGDTSEYNSGFDAGLRAAEVVALQVLRASPSPDERRTWFTYERPVDAMMGGQPSDQEMSTSPFPDRYKDALVSALHGLKYHGGLQSPEEIVAEVVADIERALT